MIFYSISGPGMRKQNARIRASSTTARTLAKGSAAAFTRVARIVQETIKALRATAGEEHQDLKKERDSIVRALTESKGRVGGADGAAARMGLKRTTLLARMKKLAIDARDYL